MIHEFNKPIPVVTPEGDGYALYVSDSGMLENDTWCVTLCKDGQLLHFNTKQLKVSKNATFGIATDLPESLSYIKPQLNTIYSKKVVDLANSITDKEDWTIADPILTDEMSLQILEILKEKGVNCRIVKDSTTTIPSYTFKKI